MIIYPLKRVNVELSINAPQKGGSVCSTKRGQKNARMDFNENLHRGDQKVEVYPVKISR